jgi:superfamily I DNA/RNA helicase
MLNASDEVPLGHDGYLKQWSVELPVLDYDYILLDEAQDTNPVVLAVLTEQKSQLVYVGDKHQQIYEWRGAINAMAKISTDHEAALTQSFRFGPNIANAANDILAKLGEERQLEGFAKIPSEIRQSLVTDAVLARTNAMVISECPASATVRQVEVFH